MKKLIAVIALASMFAVGCAKDRENKGGTSDSNYSTSDSSKMQSQPSTSTTTTNSNSSAPQQP
jgi:PBP1b-binding outer membrane lipoprotein LpoB